MPRRRNSLQSSNTAGLNAGLSEVSNSGMQDLLVQFKVGMRIEKKQEWNAYELKEEEETVINDMDGGDCTTHKCTAQVHEKDGRRTVEIKHRNVHRVARGVNKHLHSFT